MAEQLPEMDTDIEIGAVEIKDGTSDARAKISSTGATKGSAVQVLAGSDGTNAYFLLTDANGVVQIAQIGMGYATQFAIAGGGAAAQIAANAAKEIIITSVSTNASSAWLGFSAATAAANVGIELTPAEKVSLAVSNSNLVYQNTAVGDTLTVAVFN